MRYEQTTFGTRLQMARRQRGMTQAALEQSLNWKTGVVSALELGRYGPTATRNRALADALRVDPLWLGGPDVTPEPRDSELEIPWTDGPSQITPRVRPATKSSPDLSDLPMDVIENLMADPRLPANVMLCISPHSLMLWHITADTMEEYNIVLTSSEWKLAPRIHHPAGAADSFCASYRAHAAGWRHSNGSKA